MAIILKAPAPVIRLTTTIQKQPRIAFFGTPLFAVPSLRLLHGEGWPIEAVITAPDKPVGRRMTMTPSPVKTAASELGLPVHSPLSLKDEEFWTLFENLRPDLCIVVAYGKLIPQRYLEIPRLGFLNIHPSLLPAYRGPSPIQTAILDGCVQAGVSIMMLDADMDHGPILSSTPWVIPSGFDTQLCEDELSRIGARLLVDTLPEYVSGTLIPLPQEHANATYTSKYTRVDGHLDWRQTSKMLIDRIRALGANPGTWSTWQGKTLNIFYAHALDAVIPSAPPGTVFLHGTELVVACASGGVAIELLQIEGSTKQSAHDFLNGHQGIVGGMLV